MYIKKRISRDVIPHILDQLEHLMYGHNYEVTFGIDRFTNCTTLEAFAINLKKVYPDARPENVTPIRVDGNHLWEEINFGLIYRGDKESGLSLTEDKQKLLEEIQDAYKDFVAQFVTDKTTLYAYPDDEGMPGFPVYWGYQFILFANDECLFVHGSSSD